MDTKPSWQSSTLSQLMVLCCLAYVSACSYAIWKAGGSKESLEPLKWMVDVFVVGYMMRSTPKTNGTTTKAQDVAIGESRPPEPTQHTQPTGGV